jgi:hypothetical protein
MSIVRLDTPAAESPNRSNKAYSVSPYRIARISKGEDIVWPKGNLRY